MIEVIPAVIPLNLSIVRERFLKVLGLVQKVQVDIVDGEYAPTKTWPFNDVQFDEMIKMVRGEEKFPYVNDFILEVDMLTLHPIEYISDFISIGAKSFVIHLDSTDHLDECIETIKNSGCEIGIGVKPSGNMDLLESYITKIDFVQFMGNDRVGYNGVDLDPRVIEQIENFHNRHPSLPLQIDIGVNLETAPTLVKAGISRLISGSAIFNAPDISQAIQKLRSS